MALLSRKLPVKSPRHLFIRGSRSFFVIVKSNKVSPVAGHYMNLPLLILLAPTYPFEAGFISLFCRSVVLILGGCSLSEVFPPVVSPITIDVVNIARWPLSSHPEPRKPVRLPWAVIDAYFNVSMMTDAARHLTGPFSRPLGNVWPWEPRKNPSLRTVIKETSDLLGREIIAPATAVMFNSFSHLALLWPLVRAMISPAKTYHRPPFMPYFSGA